MDFFCYLYYNTNPFQHTQVYVNLVIFGKHLHPLRMGASCQPCELADQSRPLGRGEELEVKSTTSDQRFNPSCLCNEAFIEIPKEWG